ncbi:MAG: hypothetical protein QM784_26010 [Polyangiaceae bacterium]
MSTDADSLWLVVKSVERSWVFEMPAECTRVVTMGAAEHVDIRLNSPAAPPLACYFEREGDAIRIVPAYLSEHLRVDTTVAERPRWIMRRSIVELPGVVLQVRVRDEPPTSPNWEPSPSLVKEAERSNVREHLVVATPMALRRPDPSIGVALGELESPVWGALRIRSRGKVAGLQRRERGPIQ